MFENITDSISGAAESLSQYIDTEILTEPAYWIIVGLAVVGLMFGFAGSGFFATDTAYINWYVKLILFLAIFPIAYVIVKTIQK